MMFWGVDEQGWRKGPWTPEEDKLLSEYVKLHGEGRWSSVARTAGLNRSGKSCRLRWVNYLRPDLKKGHITPQEEGIIIELHALWGNKWSTIARYLPGRTDNEIKNYWRTHFKKKTKPSKIQKWKMTQTPIHQKELQQQDNNMNNNVSLHAEVLSHKTATNETQAKQEMAFPHPAKLEGDCFPVMYQDFAYWPETTTRENGLWDPYELHVAVQDQVNGYSCGGNTTNWYNEEYIF